MGLNKEQKNHSRTYQVNISLLEKCEGRGNEELTLAAMRFYYITNEDVDNYKMIDVAEINTIEDMAKILEYIKVEPIAPNMIM